jgi:hypothetical protein
MSPYRTAAAPPPLRPASQPSVGFAFRSARVRLGEHRFELSFWHSTPLCLLLMALVVLTPILPIRVMMALAVVCAIVGLPFRTTLRVTRQSSWVRWTVLGMCWSSHELGRRPALENGGYDWDEIAVVPSIAVGPSQERFLRGLHDDQRAVLAEWDEGSPPKDQDAARLIALAHAEIYRLHEDLPVFDAPGPPGAPH